MTDIANPLPDASQAPPAPSIGPPLPPSAFADPAAHHAPLSAGQAGQLIDGLLKVGMDLDTVMEAARRDGFYPEGDQRSAAQIAHDRSFGLDAAAFDPAAFHFDYPGELHSNPELAADLAAFDGAAREAFASMGMPPQLARSFLDEAFRMGREWRGMTSEQQSSRLAQEQAAIAEHFGDGLDDARKLVTGLLDKAGRDNEVAKAIRENVIRSAWGFRTLFNWGRHTADWAATRPKGSK